MFNYFDIFWMQLMLLVAVAAVSAFDYSNDFAQETDSDYVVPAVGFLPLDNGAFLRVRRAPQHHGHGGITAFVDNNKILFLQFLLI